MLHTSCVQHLILLLCCFAEASVILQVVSGKKEEFYEGTTVLGRWPLHVKDSFTRTIC
jgi:hypothetical protein